MTKSIKELQVVRDQGEYFGEMVNYKELEDLLYTSLTFYSNWLKDLDEKYDSKAADYIAKLCEINRVEGKVLLLRELLGLR